MNRRGPDPAGPRRVAVVAGLVLSLFAVAIGRAAYLQIYRAGELSERADDQRNRQVKLLAARGTIYDRNGRELAVSIPGASVFVDPSALREIPNGLQRLCQTLRLDPAAAQRQLERGGAKFAWLKRRISPAEEAGLAALRLPGVGVAREAHRFYPNKTLAGQLLGFVGSEEEGRGGLEYHFDKVLKGKDAWVKAERDARGTLLLTGAPDPTEGQGESLQLTLDETIQHIVEEELARSVSDCGAKNGVAVVMEPATGEILALAEFPGFNPNAVASSRSDARKLRAATDVYEPGSTFKALFLGILLDRHVIRPSDTVFCENGAWHTGRQTIHDHSRHGWLTVEEILKVSSNIGVAKLSERITAEDFHEGLLGFGIGAPTGVDLPGESRGILPSLRSWGKITSKTAAFGQGVSATYIQVASALSAIANGGVRMKPHVVSAVLHEGKTVSERFDPVPQGRAISAEAAASLTKMMETVVQGEGGTAPMAAVPGYTVAGKTGTAWKPDPHGHGYARNALICSFVGFVPSRSPKIAVLVAVDEPTKGSLYGGTIAAPAFREMARQILAYLQVPPEPGAAVAKATVKTPPAPDLEGLNLPPPSAQTAQGAMPDVRGLTMREALRRVQSTGVGVRLTVLGSGVATKQDPVPGSLLAEGKPCRIEFQPLL